MAVARPPIWTDRFHRFAQLLRHQNATTLFPNKSGFVGCHRMGNGDGDEDYDAMFVYPHQLIVTMGSFSHRQHQIYRQSHIGRINSTLNNETFSF